MKKPNQARLDAYMLAVASSGTYGLGGDKAENHPALEASRVLEAALLLIDAADKALVTGSVESQVVAFDHDPKEAAVAERKAALKEKFAGSTFKTKRVPPHLRRARPAR